MIARADVTPIGAEAPGTVGMVPWENGRGTASGLTEAAVTEGASLRARVAATQSVSSAPPVRATGDACDAGLRRPHMPAD